MLFSKNLFLGNKDRFFNIVDFGLISRASIEYFLQSYCKIYFRKVVGKRGMKKVGMLAKMLLISVNLPRGDVISATYGERYCPFSSLSKSCPQTSNLLVVGKRGMKKVGMLAKMLLISVNLPRGDVISTTYGERYFPFSSLSKSCPQTSNLLWNFCSVPLMMKLSGTVTFARNLSIMQAQMFEYSTRDLELKQKWVPICKKIKL
ncbi:uncharacterized protein LOC107762046 isoform X2 [Nicotiana tabacum]|uniref:Uncharacterized protein LOC107762046 isoform X2 n=1 Tax=Nicotiana tabacum TaxID=4097 RepID=A0AC58SH09_TOBAC